jgi:DNA processing protein
VRGDAIALNRHSISMVGTRRPTPCGIQVAVRLGADPAERGLTFLSGMARGRDSVADQGACLASRGAQSRRSAPRGGCPPSKENKKIFAEVEKRGALISEFPLGAPRRLSISRGIAL